MTISDKNQSTYPASHEDWIKLVLNRGAEWSGWLDNAEIVRAMQFAFDAGWRAGHAFYVKARCENHGR